MLDHRTRSCTSSADVRGDGSPVPGHSVTETGCITSSDIREKDLKRVRIPFSLSTASMAVSSRFLASGDGLLQQGKLNKAGNGRQRLLHLMHDPRGHLPHGAQLGGLHQELLAFLDLCAHFVERGRQGLELITAPDDHLVPEDPSPILRVASFRISMGTRLLRMRLELRTNTRASESRGWPGTSS